jgi:thiaminase/transcriptional activator TenA
LVQDYIFLKHFSRAWGLAVAKADTIAEMSACAQTVVALLTHEMQLHEQVCAQAGIDLVTLQNAQEAPENLAYTRYVLEAGYSGDFLTLMAALAPCVLGYGEIGATLKKSAVSTQYADWIETYGGAEYQELCREVGGLIDGAVEARYGANFANLPVWQNLTETFVTATRLEVGFWDMGLRGA